MPTTRLPRTCSPFALLIVATASEQDGEHDPGQHQQGTLHQTPASEPLAEQPEPEQGGEERVAGESRPLRLGPSRFMQAKRAVSPTKMPTRPESASRGRALGERLPAPGGELALASIRADQEHAPAAGRQRPPDGAPV